VAIPIPLRSRQRPPTCPGNYSCPEIAHRSKQRRRGAQNADARQIADYAVHPSNAKQRRIEGWELNWQWVPMAAGDVNVIASDPARVFDRETMRPNGGASSHVGG
jgi:hypothetical protein